MNLYLRKIDNQCIRKQISITQEVLKGFFKGTSSNGSSMMKGKISKYEGEVSYLTATDPRLGGEIKKIIVEEGGMNIDDILLFTKIKNKYTIEVVTKTDKRYDSFFEMFDSDKHLIVYVDETEGISSTINYETEYDDKGFSHNRILFGAPGTGKSFSLNEDKKTLLGACNKNYERVTFHPDYSYAQFVGTYKPVPCKDSEDKDAITYEYVPGPFTRTLVRALKSGMTANLKPYLLIVEEINRANVAAVFGDIFQLLDRDDNGVSEYAIQTSEDMRKYLAKELNIDPEECAEIKVPNNMFIWATMNSADQGVYPMDTAFKRRWDFTYIGINDSEEGIADKAVILGKDDNARIVNWNELRKAINNELLTYKVNEDKLLGPYFISKKSLSGDENGKIDEATFINMFKNKVIMYLFDDAAKQKRPSLFDGCTIKNLYSEICREFDTKGVLIFSEEIRNKFNNKPVVDTIEDDVVQGE